MILVVGSTGLLGGQIVRQLRADGQSVRALVRPSSQQKGDALAAAGAEVVLGDLREAASLLRACDGVQTVISTASAMTSQNPGDTLDAVDGEGQRVLVGTAENAGVRRFVYVSAPEQAERSPLGDAKAAVEKRLRTARLSATIVRPTFFMEVWLSPMLGFDYVEGRVRLYGDGKQPISWISIKDTAALVRWAALPDTAFEGVINLGGPQALSPEEVIVRFERIANRKFSRELVPAEALAAQHVAALDPRQRTFFAIACQYARGHAVDPAALPPGAPRPQFTIEDYARKVLIRSAS